MVDAAKIPLTDASDAALVEELFRRHPDGIVVYGTNSEDLIVERQGDVLRVLGMIEKAKHDLLRPTLHDLV